MPARGGGEDDRARHFLGGGELSRDWLLSLADAARDQEVWTCLRASKFGPAWVGLDTLDLIQVQRALDRDLARFGIAFFARDPLTIAPAIGFITAKRVEVTNVRVIAKGIALGLGHAAIEKELVL